MNKQVNQVTASHVIDDELLSSSELDFNELYINMYLASRNKSDSYRKACQCTGYAVPTKFLSQTANKYHIKLNKEGAIDKAFQALAMDDRIDSRNVLNELRDDKESGANVRFQVAKLQVGDMYSEEATSAGIEVHVNRDNVKITHKNQTLIVEKE